MNWSDSSLILHPSSFPNARVISDLVTDKQGEGGLGQVVQRPGPGVQVNLLLFVQAAQAVVEGARRQCRVRLLGLAEQFRQRAVAGGSVVPARQARENGRGPVGGAVFRGAVTRGVGQVL